jgi:hypothetical protein
MNSNPRILCALIAGCFLLSPCAYAKIELSYLISDGMVVQRQEPIVCGAGQKPTPKSLLHLPEKNSRSAVMMPEHGVLFSAPKMPAAPMNYRSAAAMNCRLNLSS